LRNRDVAHEPTGMYLRRSREAVPVAALGDSGWRETLFWRWLFV